MEGPASSFRETNSLLFGEALLLPAQEAVQCDAQEALPSGAQPEMAPTHPPSQEKESSHTPIQGRPSPMDPPTAKDPKVLGIRLLTGCCFFCLWGTFLTEL